MSRSAPYDCLVAGAGPVGLAAATALAELGLSIALAGPLPEAGASLLDPRTFALFQPALIFLERLGLWPMPAGTTAPLRSIRLVDDTGRLLRAPDAHFEAGEVGMEAFGHNIPHPALVKALSARVRALIAPERLLPANVAGLATGDGLVRIQLSNGDQIEARLLIGADGRTSACRRLAGMRTGGWAYPQAAVVASVEHSRPHGDVSTEIHRPAGPLTTVPLPGNASSIVWLEHPAAARHIADLDDGAFANHLRDSLQGMLGRIEAVGPRQLFPLEGLIADTAAQDRVALVGEALHAFPPIGAQGLNLGFRDVASLVDGLANARQAGLDIGGDATLAAYAEDRRDDVRFRTVMVDMLDRTLFSELVPMQLARGAGLHALNALPGLRRAVMQHGMGPIGTLPSLMRR